MLNLIVSTYLRGISTQIFRLGDVQEFFKFDPLAAVLLNELGYGFYLLHLLSTPCMVFRHSAVIAFVRK